MWSGGGWIFAAGCCGCDASGSVGVVDVAWVLCGRSVGAWLPVRAELAPPTSPLTPQALLHAAAVCSQHYLQPTTHAN